MLTANALGPCTDRVSQRCGVSCRDNAGPEPEPEPAELDDEDEIQRAIAMSLAEDDEQPVQAGAEDGPAEHVAAAEGAEQTDATPVGAGSSEPTVRTSFAKQVRHASLAADAARAQAQPVGGDGAAPVTPEELRRRRLARFG